MWLALSTVDDAGLPMVSYTPFAAVAGALGIVVSRLAAHSAPLHARRPAAVLVVETHTQAGDAYMRARLSIAVTVSPLAADSEHAVAIWSALEQRQGETVRTLRMLPDFDAIRLEPKEGRLVLGFASAHNLSGPQIAAVLETGV